MVFLPFSLLPPILVFFCLGVYLTWFPIPSLFAHPAPAHPVPVGEGSLSSWLPSSLSCPPLSAVLCASLPSLCVTKICAQSSALPFVSDLSHLLRSWQSVKNYLSSQNYTVKILLLLMEKLLSQRY